MRQGTRAKPAVSLACGLFHGVGNMLNIDDDDTVTTVIIKTLWLSMICLTVFFSALASN